MSKSKVVEFNKEELKKLIEDKNSCVTVHKSFYNLALYPYHLTSLTSSIKDILNARVAKYDKKLDGILLGYKNVKILTPQGSIVTDSCYIHIDIEADFYIFKPEMGATLTGIVNKKSKDHVGCLVHRIFNVSVPNKSEEESWPGYNVEIGQEVFLQVTYINLDARLPYIRTSFISTKSKKKKRKSKTSDEVDAANGENKIEEFKLNKMAVLNNEDQVNEQSPKKKKKKSEKVKSKDEINNVVNAVLDSTAEMKSEEKKKRKSKDKNDSLIINVNITAEEEKINNLLNNIMDSPEALESHKKKKRKTKENNATLKKLDITEELAKVSNVEDISVNTNAEVKAHKKKKRKSVDASNISVNLSTNSNVLSETPNAKVNGIDTDLQTLRKSLLAEQLANLNQLETPKNLKKRKRKSDEFNTESSTNNNEISSQSEVRKSKKRKTSFSENMSEENPALRDSYANTTIDSYSSPNKGKKKKHKHSHNKSELDTILNTSTVIETSNKNRKQSMSESEETELKKKKRKHKVTENQNESQDLDNSSSIKKKYKSKKSKHKNVYIDN